MKGYEKFEAALDKIEALFENKRFNGKFDMRTFGCHYGDHEPEEQNHCGTVACLAGWLVMVDPEYKEITGAKWRAGRLNETKTTFESAAAVHYGVSKMGSDELFWTGLGIKGKKGLKQKIKEARKLIAEARDEER